MLFNVFSRSKMLALFIAKLDGGNKLRQGLIAFQAYWHQWQSAPVLHRDLGTDDRLYTLLYRLEMESHSPRDRVAIDQRDRWYSQLRRARRESLRLRSRREKAKS